MCDITIECKIAGEGAGANRKFGSEEASISLHSLYVNFLKDWKVCGWKIDYGHDHRERVALDRTLHESYANARTNLVGRTSVQFLGWYLRGGNFNVVHFVAKTICKKSML